MTWHCRHEDRGSVWHTSAVEHGESGVFSTITQARPYLDATLSSTWCVAICQCFFLIGFDTDLLSWSCLKRVNSEIREINWINWIFTGERRSVKENNHILISNASGDFFVPEKNVVYEDGCLIFNIFLLYFSFHSPFGLYATEWYEFL